ncbi:MAG: bifunctional diaminohydroxyphosphoribosylaminopyrimidine deaminase/5-amino-6-(5-phosphoribosylamino)uracil reductase RibD [Syntrophobacteraceae bacterium]
MEFTEIDKRMMHRAISLAGKGAGWASPNPMVGAVVAHGETLVGEGYHERVGGPHAEVNALRQAGSRATGATLYVTLEPCNHQGRTPPCSLAVLDAEISRVVIGMSDPNPKVDGGGAAFLSSRGIRVEIGLLEKECRLLNQPFIKHITTGLPYVTIKTAATLDGRIASRTGDSRWVSNEKSRRFVHRLRCDLDGILVGIETALKDNPQLTARVRGRKPCRQPVRMVLDSHLRIDPSSTLVQTAREVPLWVACTEQASAENASLLEDAGVELLRLPMKNGSMELHALLHELGRRQLASLLIEGGARTIGGFIDQGLADAFCFFYAPKVLGDAEGIPMIAGEPRSTMSLATPVFDVRWKHFGDDMMAYGRFHEAIY